MLTNRSSFFTHSINSISRLKVFKSFHNIFSNNQHWSHFSYSRVNSRTYLLMLINRSFFLVVKIVTIIEFENQSAFQQNLQNRSSFISIRAIRFARESSRITSIDSANQSQLFKICDEINNIRNSNLNSILQFNIEIIRLLRKHYEIISDSLTKNLVFFVSMLNSISSRQKRQESFSEIFICYQHNIQLKSSSICIRIFLWNFRKINEFWFVCFAKTTEIESSNIFIVFQFRFLRFASRYRFFWFKFKAQWLKSQTFQWDFELFAKFEALSTFISISKDTFIFVLIQLSQWFDL